MLRQYHAGRGRTLQSDPRNLVGPVSAGKFVRINGELCRVEAWHPREYTCHHKAADGKWRSVFIRGGHLATIRRIRDNRAFQMGDTQLFAAADI